jgi:purine-binding chemotaxis protein CheW
MSPGQPDAPMPVMENGNRTLSEYVTAIIGGQLFGLPIRRVQDVFAPERVTRVPLAPPEIAGVLNLRGRIVTLIDLRHQLGLDRAAQQGPSMAIGVELRGESYGLMIDSIGEVLQLDDDAREPNPPNLDPALARMSAGIYRLEGQLLMVLEVDRLLDGAGYAHAA